MDLLVYIAVVASAYLVGSFPTGYLVGRMKGLDIRTLGSGNIGATNVFRSLGTPAGVFVLLVDALKGYAACTAVARGIAILFQRTASGPIPSQETLSIVAGLAAVLGHNYTCWLRFKGGKGIATSAGVLLALVPLGLLIAFAAWVGVFLFSGYVSLGSLAAALVLPFAVWATGGSPRMIVITGILSALAIYKHRSNIQRLLNGTEHRFGAKKSRAA